MRMLKLFLLGALLYGIIGANMRAMAHAWMTVAFLTDLSCGYVSALTIMYLAHATTKWERVAYALGGAIGAQVAILVTKHYFGV